jgi:uncharacterized membrane protein
MLTATQIQNASLLTMAGFYILAGSNHLFRPRTYLSIMPPSLPSPLLLIYLSGIAELALGIALLFPKFRPFAAWGVIALLIAVFPANVRMYQLADTVYSNIRPWILLWRLPFQLVLIAWAYSFT